MNIKNTPAIKAKKSLISLVKAGQFQALKETANQLNFADPMDSCYRTKFTAI